MERPCAWVASPLVVPPHNTHEDLLLHRHNVVVANKGHGLFNWLWPTREWLYMHYTAVWLTLRPAVRSLRILYGRFLNLYGRLHVRFWVRQIIKIYLKASMGRWPLEPLKRPAIFAWWHFVFENCYCFRYKFCTMYCLALCAGTR